MAPSMNRPNSSSPTTPTMATRRPSRAAPQAVMTELLPTVRPIPPTIRSAWPKTGRGSGSDTMMSGFTSPTTRRSNGRAGRAGSGVHLAGQYRAYQPGSGASGRWASSSGAATDRPSSPVRSTRRRRRATPSVSSHCVRPSGGIVADADQTERPTSTPLAPARHADLDLRLEGRVIDPAREEDPRQSRGRVELRAGIDPARPIVDRSRRTGIPP